MERSEPTLVPEWLKSNGSSSSSNQLFATSSLHSVDHPVSKYTRNKSSVSSDNNVRRTSLSDRTTSSYFRRSSSSNGSGHLRSYGSFTRGHRESVRGNDVNGYHDKDKLSVGDHRHLDYSDPLASILPSRFEKDVLRRSQSMLTGKRSETWPRKVAGELTNANKSNRNNSNGLRGGLSAIGNVDKTAFERDFPSLGAEEKQGGLEIGRASSPGLSTAIQSLPVGTSTMIGGEGWTSALAEVPVGVGSSGMTATSAQQAFSASSASISTSMTGGLNMAETVAQGPFRARTPPLLTVGTQKLEELAIKQSRQLIPVTPSVPKTLVVGCSEKSKPKIGQLQNPSNAVNHTRGGPVRSDSVKTSNESRLQVLKPSRELTGVSSTSKDCSSPTIGSKVVNSVLGITPSAAGSALLRSSSHSSSFIYAERNQAQAPLRIAVDKRPTFQAQSRNDFFNLIKNKSSTNSPSSLSGPGPTVSPSVSEKSDDFVTESADDSITQLGRDALSLETYSADLSTGNRDEITDNSNAYDMSQGCLNIGGKHLDPDVIVYPDEEEAAFLRSLGWEENAGEEEGLTEEEISAFVAEYMKLRPSSKLLHDMRSVVTLNSENGSCDGASSGFSSSDTKLES